MDRVAWLAAITIAVVALALTMFAAYPSIVLGVDVHVLAESVQDETGALPESSEMPPTCEERSDFYLCGRYLVEVDWRGCWEANLFVGTRADPRVLVGRKARHASACLRLGDHLPRIPGPG
jgi:hypothetical protein